MPALSVCPESQDWHLLAHEWACRLALPLVDHSPRHGLVLGIGPEGLALSDADAPREQPLRVDFVEGALGYRQRQGFRKDELLAKAVGIKSGWRPKVFDATAGLGRDAFMLASLGCDVTLCERHPVVHALLEDGLRRAASAPELAPVLDRMHLLAFDALGYMDQWPEDGMVDVIFLDPMFPERGKSALVKKPMRLFHALVGADEDADSLLDLALRHAGKRVVVKRPLHSGVLAGRAPQVVYKGKAVRFDVYLAA
ncbi:MAG: class I SAM-dependent methyltransferase [Pseudomonadota bacterium]